MGRRDPRSGSRCPGPRRRRGPATPAPRTAKSRASAPVRRLSGKRLEADHEEDRRSQRSQVHAVERVDPVHVSQSIVAAGPAQVVERFDAFEGRGHGRAIYRWRSGTRNRGSSRCGSGVGDCWRRKAHQYGVDAGFGGGPIFGGHVSSTVVRERERVAAPLARPEAKRWWVPVLAFVAIAVVLWAVAGLAATHLGRTEQYSPAPAHFIGGPLFEPWARWDASWYRTIVEQGYVYYPGVQSSVAFWPSYPMAIRLFEGVSPSPFITGSLLTLVVRSGLCGAVLRVVHGADAPTSRDHVAVVAAAVPVRVVPLRRGVCRRLLPGGDAGGVPRAGAGPVVARRACSVSSPRPRDPSGSSSPSPSCCC